METECGASSVRLAGRQQGSGGGFKAEAVYRKVRTEVFKCQGKGLSERI